jgi:hypothetical protein
MATGCSWKVGFFWPLDMVVAWEDFIFTRQGSLVFCWIPATLSCLAVRLPTQQLRLLLYTGPGVWLSSSLCSLHLPLSSCFILIAGWLDWYSGEQIEQLTQFLLVWYFSFSTVKKNKFMLLCLWIGHVHPTRGHLLYGELTSVCVNCGASLTMSRILVECPYYGKAYLVYDHNGVLPDMFGVNCHSFSNFFFCFKSIGLVMSV